MSHPQLIAIEFWDLRFEDALADADYERAEEYRKLRDKEMKKPN